MATDAPGLRSVMESAQPPRKGLAVVAGFCWRHYARREFSNVLPIYAIAYANHVRHLPHRPVKPMPPDSLVKRNGVTLNGKRNWYNFTGAEAMVWWNRPHSVDKISGSLATNRRVAPQPLAVVNARIIPAISGPYRGQHLRKRARGFSANARFWSWREQGHIHGTMGRATIARGQCIIQNEDGIWRYEGFAQHVPGERRDVRQHPRWQPHQQWRPCAMPP